jgi:hypothetical protein
MKNKLSFYDQSGARVSLHRLGDSAALHFYTAEGNASVIVGDADGPLVSLRDEQGYQTTLGTTDLETPRTGEAHKTSAASLVMFNKDGKVIWSAPLIRRLAPCL